MQKVPQPSAEHDSLLKKAEQLELEKQQLISLVSHDLRSPLNRAFALAELLLMDQSALSDFQKDYLEKMRLVIADGLSMMRNLVDYRNLEFRSIDIMPGPVNIAEYVDKLVRECQSTTTKKEIAVHVQHTGTVGVVSDKQCLDRAIGNILSNAIKFSKPGKNIFIRTKKQADGSVHVEIEDEIGGFSVAEQETLFSKFKKYKALPTGNESSTGLGLFVSRAMAQRVGGNVVCTSTEGAGSVFTIMLPATLP
jgi:signal transduction histidine kinase